MGAEAEAKAVAEVKAVAAAQVKEEAKAEKDRQDKGKMKAGFFEAGFGLRKGPDKNGKFEECPHHYPHRLNSFEKGKEDDDVKKKCADLVCKSSDCRRNIETKEDHVKTGHIFCAYKISVEEEKTVKKNKAGCGAIFCPGTTDTLEKHNIDHLVSVCSSIKPSKLLEMQRGKDQKEKTKELDKKKEDEENQEDD